MFGKCQFLWGRLSVRYWGNYFEESIKPARNAKGNRIGVLPQHVLAQVSGLVGAGAWHFGRRCGKGGVTCANRTRWRPFRGAGPLPKITPAPEIIVTCAANSHHLRQDYPPPASSATCIEESGLPPELVDAAKWERTGRSRRKCPRGKCPRRKWMFPKATPGSRRGILRRSRG